MIVGGGIAGASLGARLAGDANILLIEAETLCGRHSTGRSVAFWQASLGGDSPARRLSLRSKPMFDSHWPGTQGPLLRPRGALHLTSAGHDLVEGGGALDGEFALERLDRASLDRKVPGLRAQWTGAWWEPSCADIEVAAFHGACLAAIHRAGGTVRTDSALLGARRSGEGWIVTTSGGDVKAGLLVNAAGAWADPVAEACGLPAIPIEPRRRTVVQLRVGQTGLRNLPLVTDLHQSFYFKGEGDNVVWVSPLDETLADPCDAAPEEIDVATAIDRFQKAVDWPVEAVERKWAGLRSFAPDARDAIRLRSARSCFLLVRGAGRDGHPDRAGRLPAVRELDSG